jgi:hypothetical protein
MKAEEHPRSNVDKTLTRFALKCTKGPLYTGFHFLRAHSHLPGQSYPLTTNLLLVKLLEFRKKLIHPRVSQE